MRSSTGLYWAASSRGRYPTGWPSTCTATALASNSFIGSGTNAAITWCSEPRGRCAGPSTARRADRCARSPTTCWPAHELRVHNSTSWYLMINGGRNVRRVTSPRRNSATRSRAGLASTTTVTPRTLSSKVKCVIAWSLCPLRRHGLFAADTEADACQPSSVGAACHLSCCVVPSDTGQSRTVE